MAQKGTPISDEHRAKIKATWDEKRAAAGGVLTREVRPDALVRGAHTIIEKYGPPPPAQLSHLECAVLTAIAKHTAGRDVDGCVLSMVIFPPSLSDHVKFTCTCGAAFEVSGLEAATYVHR